VEIMRKSIEELHYQSKLNIFETQLAIKFVKDTFQKELAEKLDLKRVTAPMFVLSTSGLNDHLNGTEVPVKFYMSSIHEEIEIVHSLAKWKRMALKKYGFTANSGLYTDMNAIRKDEQIDFMHSIYVDQWDWEKVITKEQRTIDYLKEIVCKIYDAIYYLKEEVEQKYPCLQNDLPKTIHFISTTQLEEMYPNLSRKEREDAITRKYKAVFLYQIGWNLKDNLPHDGRAADYDDWNLNGDILLHYDLYDMAFEISSMGIRVDTESLTKQLKWKKEEYKLENPYCKSILNNQLPLSIGGGIGQSRLCMFMLKKAHIGEVQVSIWDEEEIKRLRELNIELL